MTLPSGLTAPLAATERPLAATARPLAAASSVPIRTRIPRARLALRNRRDRILNWLALLALVSLGVVWPPVFAALATLPDVHAGTDLHAGSRVLPSNADPFDAIRPGGLLRLS